MLHLFPKRQVLVVLSGDSQLACNRVQSSVRFSARAYCMSIWPTNDQTRSNDFIFFTTASKIDARAPQLMHHCPVPVLTAAAMFKCHKELHVSSWKVVALMATKGQELVANFTDKLLMAWPCKKTWGNKNLSIMSVTLSGGPVILQIWLIWTGAVRLPITIYHYQRSACQKKHPLSDSTPLSAQAGNIKLSKVLTPFFVDIPISVR